MIVKMTNEQRVVDAANKADQHMADGRCGAAATWYGLAYSASYDATSAADAAGDLGSAARHRAEGFRYFMKAQDARDAYGRMHMGI